MSTKVTMQDIADALQISVVTVSNALSNKEGVGKELRYKIRETAMAMDYPLQPNSKSEKKNTKHTAGVIMAECFCSDNAFYSLLYEKLLLEFEKADYSCILEVIPYEDEMKGVLPKMVLEDKVDGIVVLGQVKRSYIDMLVIEDIPYIFLDFYDEHYSVDSIVSDSVCGSYLLTNYLIENGYKKIGFVGNLKATSSILDRYLGYYKALFQSGLKLRQDWIISDRDQAGNFILPIALPKELFVSLWRYMGQNMVMFSGAMQSINSDLLEAASLDGANSWQQFRYIILPNIKTIVSLNLILAVKGAISVYEIPMIMTNGANGSSTFVMKTLDTAFTSRKIGLASAMGVVLLVFIMIVTFIQKRFIEGKEEA